MKKIVCSFVVLLSVFSVFALDGFIKHSTLYIKSNVKDFSEVTIRQNVINGKAVTFSPLDLKVGDIFIDVDGGAKKVTEIIRNGKSINIKTVKPKIEEVFEYINVPEQDVDFKEATEDYFDRHYNELRENEISKTAAKSAVHKTFLDENLPTYGEGVKYFETTIKVYTKDIKGLSSPTRLENILTERDMEEIDDEEEIRAFKQLKENNKRKGSVKTSADVSITPKIRYRANFDKANTGFKYASTQLDKKGTWKFWKWRLEYVPGYVKFDYLRDTEVGLGLKVTGGINSTYGIPLYQLGGPVGPYLKVSYDIKGNCAANIEYQYYARDCEFLRASANVNFVLAPSNIDTGRCVWSPSVHEVDFYFSGGISTGPSVKVGFTVLKLEVVQFSAGVGIGVDGLIGGQWRKINLDEKNYENLVASIPSDFPTRDSALNILKKGFDGLKECESGFNFLANASLYAYGTIDACLLNNYWKTNLLNAKVVFWNLKGFQATPLFSSPFQDFM